MSEKQPIKLQLEPLDIKCTNTDCENGLHCFKQTAKMKAANQKGRCRACGVELVDWERVRMNDIGDAGYAFSALKFELIRHHFWHVDIDDKALDHARRKGRSGMRVAAEQRIRSSVGPAEPGYDGRQTPKQGNVLYYAQHATASCCRQCMEEWHGIAMGRALTDEEIGYLSALLILYVEERLPWLPEYGEKVARRRIKADDEEDNTLCL